MGLLRKRTTDADTRARVNEALVRLRSLLPLDECTVELLNYSDGVAVLRVNGACSHCEMDVRSLVHGIEAHVRGSVMEIREVRIEGAVTTSQQGGAA